MENSENAITSKHYMLVSDASASSGNQFDTKKISWSELAAIAQDSLFRQNLNILDRYLTKNQIVSQRNQLQRLYEVQYNKFLQVAVE